jgi:hypothetical protein
LVARRAEGFDLVLGGAELAVQLGELVGVLGRCLVAGVGGVAAIRSSSVWCSVRSAASAVSRAASSVVFDEAAAPATPGGQPLGAPRWQPRYGPRRQ